MSRVYTTFVITLYNTKIMGSEGLQERVFERLFKSAEIAGFSKQELFEYEDSLKVFRDWYSVVKTAADKGFTEGFGEGFGEGEKKKQLEIAQNLKSLGIAIDVIAQSTHLSQEEIKKL